jgi:glycyl-tRNA synthetase beta chain
MLHSLLFEIYSDEIPARMQGDAWTRIPVFLQQKLSLHGLQGTIQAYASLRRIAFVIQNFGFCAQQEDQGIKGPSTKAPPHIIEQFITQYGATNCKQKNTPKGPIWFAYGAKTKPSLETASEQLCTAFLEEFYWPKRMRWHSVDEFTWIRPIHHLVCMLGEDCVPWTFHPKGLALQTQNKTRGHPCALKGSYEGAWVTIPSAGAYANILEQHGVCVCPATRKARIKSALDKLQRDYGYTAFAQDIHPQGLLNEVAGLTEQPHALLCTFPEDFLRLPEPFLLTTLRHHQRCFSLLKNGKLAAQFVVVLDGISENDFVKQGHERVAKARLSDALFFWNQDLKYPLESYNQRLKSRVFFEELGSVLDKVRRLEHVASRIDPSGALTAAASLSKADLATQAVGEFPELQGIMGKHYALTQGIDSCLAYALEEQYWPLSPSHTLDEQSTLGGMLGLIDRMDTLVGFFSLGHYPTGSKDPMALRRSAYAWVRLAAHHDYPLPIQESIRISLETYRKPHLADPLAEQDPMELLEQFIFKQFCRLLEQEGMLVHISETISPLRFAHSLKVLHETAQNLHDFSQGEAGKAFISAYKRVWYLLQQEQGALSEFTLPHPEELPEREEHSVREHLIVPWSWKSLVSQAPEFAHSIHQLLDRFPVQGVAHRLRLLQAVLRYTKPLGNFSCMLSVHE